ncbi:MAG: Npt1/Npt2 family nucleotide transporter [Gemmatimonadota bacterium]|nr:Npt1/Npt2 family nucleotide transporter [Gemmatimonadota bacterium]
MTDTVSRILNIKKEELPLAVLSAVYFFCILCGYFFLRPVRDAMGVARGMDELRWLFVCTALVSLAVVLAFGGVVARTNRRRFIPIGYLCVIGCLIVFAGMLIVDGAAGGGLIGSDTETPLARYVGYVYYVWLSTINLFVNSVFWAFMVDLFDVRQGKRMFAFIGIGGTLGAIAGGWATNVISGMTDSVYLPAGLMLIGAVFFGLAIVVMLSLDRLVFGPQRSQLTADGAAIEGHQWAGDRDVAGEGGIGGTFWEGAQAVVRSPYLLGIGAYIALMAISNTLIYFTQANIILDDRDTFSELIAGFAQLDVFAQVATLFVQIFVTTQVIKRIGVGWTLVILPLVTLAGFAVLSAWATFGVMAVFQAVHRATRYAISRPARETLFSVVSPSEKYKAKPFVDVFVYRGGDLAGAGVDSMFAAMGLTLAAVAAATVPVAGVWAVLCLALGRAQQAKDTGSPVSEPPEVG